MLRVLEIGCGDSPGPFFEGASKHFIADVNSQAVLEAVRREPCFTPLPRGDARQLPLPDSSLDIVLARNIFGDPALGLDLANRENFIREEVDIAQKLGITAQKFYRKIVDGFFYDKKSLIMHEIGRVLVPEGRLLAVEQKTPHVARDFFANFAIDSTLECSFRVKETSDLSLYTPLTYAVAHQSDERTTMWVATKNRPS
jgi:ubiquinone/menaquinone biosynthesis C-methylase UbiE